MGRIRMLADHVIGKIAAGEVVERPSAAIKELIENSLDAGARAVTVEIRDGGISYFRVTDNGSGIQQQDIRMAFERHATSKITTEQDLFSVATLGFRGEALASIAAVGHVTCTTRTAADESGIRVQNDGGQITAIEETACPQGTTIIVRDLFYNTPVRLKFLKKPAVEAGYISDLMMHMILSRADVSFRYISNGKTIYHSMGDGKLSSAIYCVYGREMFENMREVDGSAGGLVLKGYVGIGECARSNRGNECFYINGRYMKSPLLSAAVENGCRERVMIGKYPVCVLHLTMPYQNVDVNVHPNKLEVRFQNEQSVYEAVTGLVQQSLKDRDALEKPVQFRFETPKNDPNDRIEITVTDKVPVTVMKQVRTEQTEQRQEPKTETGSPEPESKTSTVLLREDPVKSPEKQFTPEVRTTERVETVSPHESEKTNAEADDTKANGTPAVNGPVPDPVAPQQTELPRELLVADHKEPLKLIGKVFQTYILVEYRDNMLMIDQHAAHERLLFDQMMQTYDREKVTQELLVPILMNVTRKEMMLLEENRELLESIGLSIDSFGDHEAAIRAIPMILGQPQAIPLVSEILEQLEGEHPFAITMEKRRADILQMACKRAIKRGDDLSMDEIRDLVERMIDGHVTPTCPHGRPLVVSISRTELDKRFKRIQS